MADTIMRNMIYDFLNIGTGSTPRWVRCGEGYTALDESPNAQTQTKAYISHTSKTKRTTGYEVSFPFSADLLADEAVMAVYEIGRGQKIGAQAERQYCRVEVFKDPVTPPDSYPARLFTVSVQVSNVKGAGAESITFDGSFNGVGDFIEGEFDISAKTFTPTVTP